MLTLTYFTRESVSLGLLFVHPTGGFKKMREKESIRRLRLFFFFLSNKVSLTRNVRVEHARLTYWSHDTAYYLAQFAKLR